jgi:hypothetical protein
VSRRRGGLLLAGVGALAAALLAASPTAAAVQIRRSASGDQAARAVLVRRADLGGGWMQSPAPTRVPGLTCPAFDPAVNGVTEVGSAASPTFGNGSSGPFVSADAYAYATAAQATKIASQVLRPQLRRCVAEGLRSASGNGTRFTVTSSDLLALPPLGVRRAGYRITGTATRSGQSVNVVLDAIVLAAGRRLVAVTASRFLVPPSRGLELRLARLLSRRLLG